MGTKVINYRVHAGESLGTCNMHHTSTVCRKYVCNDVRMYMYMFVYVRMHPYFYAKSTVNVPLKVGNYLCISFPLHSNAVQAIFMTDAIQDLWHMHLVL